MDAIKSSEQDIPDATIFWGIPRDAEGMKCECGGYADPAEPSHEEKLRFDCGRYSIGGNNCCAVAFKCAICNRRIVGKLAAPDF